MDYFGFSLRIVLTTILLLLFFHGVAFVVNLLNVPSNTAISASVLLCVVFSLLLVFVISKIWRIKWDND